MKDDRSSALRFALVASSVLLAGLAQFFISDGDLRWAVTPLVVAVGCLALASGGRRTPASSSSESSPSPPDRVRGRLQSSPIKGEEGFVPPLSTPWQRFVWLDEATLGVAAFALAAILMSVSLLDFGSSGGDDLTVAWWSFGAAVALLLAAIPALDGRWTALADRLKKIGMESTSACGIWLSGSRWQPYSRCRRRCGCTTWRTSRRASGSTRPTTCSTPVIMRSTPDGYPPTPSRPTFRPCSCSRSRPWSSSRGRDHHSQAGSGGVRSGRSRGDVPVRSPHHGDTLRFDRGVSGLCDALGHHLEPDRYARHYRSAVRGSDRVADAARRQKWTGLGLRSGGRVARTRHVVLYVVPHVSDQWSP